MSITIRFNRDTFKFRAASPGKLASHYKPFLNPSLSTAPERQQKETHLRSFCQENQRKYVAFIPKPTVPRNDRRLLSSSVQVSSHSAASPGERRLILQPENFSMQKTMAERSREGRVGREGSGTLGLRCLSGQNEREKDNLA